MRQTYHVEGVMMMTKFKLLLCCVVLGMTMGVGGCFRGGPKSTVETDSTTMGQELMDLKKAYDQGIISEAEYDKQRKRILKSK